MSDLISPVLATPVLNALSHKKEFERRRDDPRVCKALAAEALHDWGKQLGGIIKFVNMFPGDVAKLIFKHRNGLDLSPATVGKALRGKGSERTTYAAHAITMALAKGTIPTGEVRDA